METSILNGMCRCCALEGTFKDLKCTYHWMGEQEIYGDMLKECFNIDLSNEDGTDSGICEVCITQLRNAVNFKKQVLFTEEQFKKKVQGKFFKANIVKLEVQQDEADSDDNDNNLSTDEAFSNTEFEVPIKMEEPEEPKAKKRAAAKATTSRAKKAKTDAGETSKREMQAKKPTRPTMEYKLPPYMKNKNVFMNKNNLHAILLFSNATLIKTRDSSCYGCMFCKEHFVEPAKLKEHNLQKHYNKATIIDRCCSKLFENIIKVDITGLVCKICDKDISNMPDLTDHLKTIHKKQIFSNFKSQLIPFKFETDKLTCIECKQEFTSLKLLQGHMNCHFANYICEVCGAGFVTERLRAGHRKIHEEATEQFKCTQCSKTYKTLEKRNLHIKRLHEKGGKLWKCNFCGERFLDYWKKMEHLVEAHGMPSLEAKCEACGIVFKNKKRLNRHVRKHHLLERKYECDKCDKKFFERIDLQIHAPVHTGLREYKCDTCSKSYNRLYHLNAHKKIHTGMLNHNCAHCKVGFVQKATWRSHMRSKHGEEV